MPIVHPDQSLTQHQNLLAITKLSTLAEQSSQYRRGVCVTSVNLCALCGKNRFRFWVAGEARAGVIHTSRPKERSLMISKTVCCLTLAILGPAVCCADAPVETPRPVPATRPEMKELLEDMKKRPHRIPLPELTEQEKSELGERGGSYESRLRYHYVPQQEGSVFGAGAGV